MVKKLESKTSTLDDDIKQYGISIKLTLNHVKELINITNIEIQKGNVIQGKSFNNLSFKKVSKLVYYLICFGSFNINEIDIQFSLKYSQIATVCDQ